MPKRERPLTQKQMEKWERQRQASRELTNLYQTWLEEWKVSPDIPQRAIDTVYREIRRIDKEIWAGKTENIAERFSQAKERGIAASLPKKRVTFLRTLDALEELTTLSRTWYHAAPRSKQEQAEQLRKLRILLLEVEKGHIEDLVARFEQVSEPHKQDDSTDGQTNA